MAARKFSYRQERRPGGLAGVGYKKQIEIRRGSETIGTIAEESYDRWRIGFTILKPEPDDNPNSPWKWIFLKKRWPSEQAAKDFLATLDVKDPFASKGYTLYPFKNDRG